MGTTSNRKGLLRMGSWYFLFHTLLLIPIALLYFRNIELSGDPFTWVYLIILTISHFAFLSYLVFIASYFPLALFFPNKKFLHIASTIVLSIAVFVLVVDTFVFHLYRFHINSFTLNLLFGGNATEIFEFHWIVYIIIGLIFLMCIAIEYIAFRFFERFFERKNFKHGWKVFAGIAVMILASHITYAWAEAAFYSPITKASRLYPLYFPLQASDFFYNSGIVDKEKQKYQVDQYLEKGTELVHYPLNPIVTSDSASNPNILLIVVDSWHYRTMDSLVTPNIAKFSKQSDIFDNHWSGSNGTRTGIFSLFYGLPGLYWYDMLNSSKGPVFINELLERNYDIALYPNASLANPPFDRTVFVELDTINMDTEGRNSNERDVQITKEWLDYTDLLHSNVDQRPFFGFIFYDTPHAIAHPLGDKAPFQPSWDYAKYHELNNETDELEFFNLYKNSVYFTDSLVGIVLNDLKEKNLLENTVVMITGDHGQEFNDNKKNYWGHNGNYSQAQLGVPLTIYFPGKSSTSTYSHWTSHYDIVPTLFEELFNCTNDVLDYSVGFNLYDQHKRDWLVVGSHDNFAILETDRITSIHYDRSYDITTPSLDELPEAKLRATLFNEIMKQTNRYYVHNK